MGCSLHKWPNQEQLPSTLPALEALIFISAAVMTARQQMNAGGRA